LAPGRPPFLNESGRKPAEKIFYESHVFLNAIVRFLAFVIVNLSYKKC
jgi:hypothetical protein